MGEGWARSGMEEGESRWESEDVREEEESWGGGQEECLAEQVGHSEAGGVCWLRGRAAADSEREAVSGSSGSLQADPARIGRWSGGEEGERPGMDPGGLLAARMAGGARGDWRGRGCFAGLSQHSAA